MFCRAGQGSVSEIGHSLLDLFLIPSPSRDTASDGDPMWCCFEFQGRGMTEEAFGSRIRPLSKVQSGELASACSLACLSWGPVRESGGSLCRSGCPVSNDNDIRGDSATGGPREYSPGNFVQGAPQEG